MMASWGLCPSWWVTRRQSILAGILVCLRWLTLPSDTRHGPAFVRPAPRSHSVRAEHEPAQSASRQTRVVDPQAKLGSVNDMTSTVSLLFLGAGLSMRRRARDAPRRPRHLMYQQLSEVANVTTEVKEAEEPKREQPEDVNLTLMVVALFFATVLGELDKVNISIAVLPIASELELSDGDIGIASSAFFWGY
eukprot:1970110-Amphidinium_carterae.1